MDTPEDTTVRILSLNIHGWTDDRGRYDGEGISDFICRFDPTIVALQEVRLDARTYFADLTAALKMHHAFSPAEDDTFGNVIMWRTPIREPAVKTGKLKVEGAFRRSFCLISASVHGAPLSVCNVHLDHLREERRLEQLEKLRAAVAADPPLVLLGDFNSLYRADYTPAQLEQVTRERAAHHIEAPHFEVMAEVTKEYSVHPAAFKATCPYHTRVDYALLSRAKLPASGWEVVKAEITDIEVSDHAATLLALRRKK